MLGVPTPQRDCHQRKRDHSMGTRERICKSSADERICKAWCMSCFYHFLSPMLIPLFFPVPRNITRSEILNLEMWSQWKVWVLTLEFYLGSVKCLVFDFYCFSFFQNNSFCERKNSILLISNYTGINMLP